MTQILILAEVGQTKPAHRSYPELLAAAAKQLVANAAKTERPSETPKTPNNGVAPAS